MELFVGFNTAVRIALGLLSFIALIAWCRCAVSRRIKRKMSLSFGRTEENAKRRIAKLNICKPTTRYFLINPAWIDGQA
jgi:hypothetical protein